MPAPIPAASIDALVSVDPRALDAAGLKRHLIELSAALSKLAAAEAAAVAEFDHRGCCVDEGMVNVRSWLAHHTGVPRAVAGGRVLLARRLRRMPAMTDALASGVVTEAHAPNGMLPRSSRWPVARARPAIATATIRAARSPVQPVDFRVDPSSSSSPTWPPSQAPLPATRSSKTARRFPNRSCNGGCATPPSGVLAGGSIPVDLGRVTYTASAGQRRALLARDRGCIVPGCKRKPRWCEAHHVVPYPHGPTNLANLVLLCKRHHRHVHAGTIKLRQDNRIGWIVCRPDGTPLRQRPPPHLAA